MLIRLLNRLWLKSNKIYRAAEQKVYSELYIGKKGDA